MARTESARELILQDVQTTLGTIDGKEPYWTAVKTVKRLPSVPMEFEGEEKPGLMIVDTGEPETIEPKPGYQDVRTMVFGVVGVLDRPTSDEGTAVNRFMKDVHIALMADVTRGGNASNTTIVRQLNASNLFGDLCVFEIEVHVRYHCDARQQ